MSESTVILRNNTDRHKSFFIAKEYVHTVSTVYTHYTQGCGSGSASFWKAGSGFATKRKSEFGSGSRYSVSKIQIIKATVFELRRSRYSIWNNIEQSNHGSQDPDRYPTVSGIISNNRITDPRIRICGTIQLIQSIT
jgi:hypothetical protein